MMTILLTGGTGKTSTRIATLLSAASIPHILASRSGNAPLPGSKACKFDWQDKSTWTNPWNLSPDINITAVYLVAAGFMEPLDTLRPFVEMARSKGVERFVLLSATAIVQGGWGMGKVHEYLAELGERDVVEWGVLRPTWFMGSYYLTPFVVPLMGCGSLGFGKRWVADGYSTIENLSEAQHLPTIRDEGKLYSATGDGKLPWVSAEDIAAVAFRALTDEKSHDCDHLVVGPELLSYGQIAEILTSVLGKPVTHVNLTEEQIFERFVSRGMSESYARILSSMDTKIAQGSEQVQSDVVEKVTGRKPKTVRKFVEEKKGVWQ
ncbi:MAG: hypothetical protein Q9181_007298 [Wetmoreana brouardii]